MQEIDYKLYMPHCTKMHRHVMRLASLYWRNVITFHRVCILLIIAIVPNDSLAWDDRGGNQYTGQSSGKTSQEEFVSAFMIESATINELEHHKGMRNHLVAKDQNDYQELRRFMFQGHEIVRGSGTIIAVRIWKKGENQAHNDEESGSHFDSFRKLTIYLPHELPQQILSVDIDSNIIGFYSKGFIYQNSGCLGYVTKGTISFGKQIQNTRRVIINVEGTFKSAAGRNIKCGHESFNETYDAVLKSVDSLTPWEGKPTVDWQKQVSPE